ncbi:alpha/beta hydrolase fold family protein [Burkholderia sp. SJ98]|nr:alpha/beta hydrolase fold family protein [Burkholderia sp. SJ98]
MKDFLDDTLQVGDVSLHYRLQGRGPRQLVCIHGVGSYLEAWDDVVTRLAGDFRVLTFDLRGHGTSSRVRGRYEIDDFVGDALALADHVGFDRFNLAGFSLGGLIAQRMALSRPARLRRLALLATVSGRTTEERERVLARLAALRNGERGSHYDASLSRWLTEDFQARNPERIAYLRQRNAQNDPECYASAYRVLAETDFGGFCARSALSVAALTGTVRSRWPLPTRVSSQTGRSGVPKDEGRRASRRALAASSRRRPESPINRIAARTARHCIAPSSAERTSSSSRSLRHRQAGKARSIFIARSRLTPSDR